MVKYCKSYKCLNGKTAIITGANSGIGYETALEFAKRGCRVILACRNEERANKARDEIFKATGNKNVIVKLINLESLDSVRTFAKDIIKTEERLDLLVNNAGVVDLPDQITPDGVQLALAVNYLSHFLLTNLLLDLLKKSTPSRIINLSSSAAKLTRNLNLDELNKNTGIWAYYSKTKLCNIYFTQVLAKKLEGTGVTTYSLHPGAVHTEAQKFSRVLNFVASYFFLSPEAGAQTTLFVSLENGIEPDSGEHFEDCTKVKPYAGARDSEKALKLWEISEKLVELRDDKVDDKSTLNNSMDN